MIPNKFIESDPVAQLVSRIGVEVNSLRHEVHDLEATNREVLRGFIEFVRYVDDVNPDIKYGYFAKKQLKGD